MKSYMILDHSLRIEIANNILDLVPDINALAIRQITLEAIHQCIKKQLELEQSNEL